MIDIYRKIADVLPASDRLKWVMLVMGMTFTALLETIGISLIPLFIGALTASESGQTNSFFLQVTAAMGLTDTNRLFLFGSAGLVLFFLIKNAYILIYNFAESTYIWNRYTYIGNKLLTAYTRAPFTFHRETHTTTLQKNIAEEARYFIENLLTPSLQILRNVLVTCVIGILLLIVEPKITIGSLLLIGGAGALIMVSVKRTMTAQGENAHYARLAILRRSRDLFSGMRELRVLQRTNLFRDDTAKQIGRFSKAQTYFMTAQNANKPLIETLAVAGVTGISLMMWFEGRTLTEILPVLSLFGIATVRLLPEVRLLIGNMNAVRYFKKTLTPIHHDLQLFSGITEDVTVKSENHSKTAAELSVREAPLSAREELLSPREEPLSPKEGGVSIEVNHLTYRYPDGVDPVLENLSFVLEKGSFTGLVGQSGSGKSTFVDLLLGLLDPQQGTIRLDGTPVKQWLQQHPGGVGYIPQTMFLADDTLRRNIALGIPDHEIDDERIDECLLDAQLQSFVHSLPNGLDTMTGEQGVRLSGGQRQRLGIARALYHKPALIVMDEATSALDQTMELELLDAIQTLKGRCTMVIISHRSSGLKNCDQIFVLKNKKIERLDVDHPVSVSEEDRV